MREQVIEFFRNLPNKKSTQFNSGLELYRSSSLHNTNVVRHLNASGFTPDNLATILYELKKLHNIKSSELMAAPVVKNTEVPTVSKKESIDNVFTDAPDEVKESVKLRDRYPFLKEADCPDELKILVADKFTAYDRYVEAHNALLVIVPDGETEPVTMTNEKIFELAKTAVENFELNELIQTELDYYLEHKQVLGKHSIFSERMLKKEIEKMTLSEAVKRISNLKNYIAREKSKLKKTKDTEKISKTKEKISGFEREMKLINIRHNLNG